ncbi:MAG: bifunctional tetrahydrofolate synthase/dihydrofolate synthase [Gammaproteobacteria bacterium]
MRFSRLDEWLAWLEAGSGSRIELGLERVAAVLQRLGWSQPGWPLITVAGTNGKGSSVAFLEAILEAAGYRVGTYTSPHLLRYNERIRVDATPVADEVICEAFARVDSAREGIELTYFEFGTLAAIDHFARLEPDVVILEVGLGGRLDACNVLDADVALVTRIGLDHQEWLGPDRNAIAREKAGIFRAGRPAVCGDPDPPATLFEEAERLGARLLVSGRDFRFRSTAPGWEWQSGLRRRTALPVPGLLGRHQVANAAAVLMVLELLADRLPVGQSAIRTGLMAASLPGRFQVVPGSPEVILDVAHNPQAAAVVAELLRQRPCKGRTHAVLAMLADKAVAEFVTRFDGVVDLWHLAGLSVPRGLDVDSLERRFGQSGQVPASRSAGVVEAFARAREAAGPDDRILVCGSFHTVAEMARGDV